MEYINGGIMKLKIFLVAVMLLLLFRTGGSTALAGNIDPGGDGHKYAYGESIGWIDFTPSEGSGVTVADSDVTGNAWSENAGWLVMDPGGIINDGYGNLSGCAWGENIGWISFSCDTTDCDTVPYGVYVDPDTGEFSGNAWGESIGWISFDYTGSETYGVVTSWGIQCIDNDGDGYGDPACIKCTYPEPDCNDTDGNINPGATEACNSTDDDCDGSVDEDYNLGELCTGGSGECESDGFYVCTADESGTECDAVPGKPTQEICGDGIDQNCDGSDPLCPEDVDNDGDGYTENQGDCNDAIDSIHPGAFDVPNDSIDQDCDGSSVTFPYLNCFISNLW
jgi:hypothetical protein